MNRKLFLSTILAAVVMTAATPEEAIRQAEKDWATAVVKKDYATLERVLAPDLAYTHSDGRLDTRQSLIESLRSGKQTYDAAEHQSIDVRMLGKDVAMVRVKVRMTAASGGAKGAPADFSVLRVYKLNNGQWQMTGHQSARLAK